MSAIQVGDDVFVRDPSRFEPGCHAITGHIVSVEGENCTIDAFIGHEGRCDPKVVTVPLKDVGRRLGTPISQISGRPGHPGFAEFSRIARSWGYE